MAVRQMLRGPLLLAAVVLLSGCYNYQNSPAPVVFPREGRAGSTAAIVIDSNYIPAGDDAEWTGLDPATVHVWIQEESATPGWQLPAVVRAVFELQPDKWSELGLLQPGVTGTVVLFDLPDRAAFDADQAAPDVDTSSPLNTLVIVTTDDQPPAMPPPPEFIRRISFFEIQGGNRTVGPHGEGTWTESQPIQLADFLEPSGETFLEKPPHAIVRLRMKRGTLVEGQIVGSVAFTLEYNLPGQNPCVSAVLDATPRSEAGATAIALVSPAVGSTQRVSLLAPRGFQPVFVSETGYDPEVSGQGPFLDLLVDVDEAVSQCDLADVTSGGWFNILDLTITDPDGSPLTGGGGLELDGVAAEVDYPGQSSSSALLRAYLIDRAAS